MGRLVAGSSSFCLYFIFFSPAVTRKLPLTSKREIRPNTDFVLAKTKEPRLGAWQASVAHAHRGLAVRDPRGVTRVSHIRVCRAARGELQIGRRGAPMDGWADSVRLPEKGIGAFIPGAPKIDEMWDSASGLF